MADLIEQMSTNLRGLSPGRKLALLSVLAAAIAGAVVVWLWAQRPDLQTLFSNLSSEDAAAVVAKLREAHVAYEFSADGGAILVPSEKVHELRLQLASQGLPQGGGVGFEIFDRTSFGTTEFVQKLNYRRALQGELARTIGQLAEVSHARVHLVVPEHSLFTERQEPARASIVVSLRSGRTLAANQVQGIVHLVASSVEGLRPQEVTVIDSHGQVLTQAAGEADAPIGRGHTEFQRGLEQDLEARIQTMLERVVGPNRAVVRVSSVLDLRQVELTEEKFDPDTQVVRSEQRSQEKLNGSTEGPGPTGVPGVLSNLPGGAAAGATGATSRNATDKQNEVVNYEISKTVSRILEPAGTIKQLSVAALVDGTYESAKGADGQTSRKYVPRSDEELKKLEELIKKAMGYSEQRKDQVVITNVAFEANAVGDEEAAAPATLASRLAPWLPLARYAAAGALVGVVLLFVVRPVLKALLAPPASSAGGYVPLAAGGEVGRPGLPAREQMIQLAKDNPQAAAMIVRKWLKEK